MPQSWEAKLKAGFDGLAVNKGVLAKHQVNRLPRFIGEYVVASFTDAEGRIDVQELDEYLARYYPERRVANMVKEELRKYGSYNLIDEYQVTVDLKSGVTKLRVPLLDISDGAVHHQIVDDNPRLLVDGVWGLGKLEYTPQDKKVKLATLTPMQLSNLDLEPYLNQRAMFNSDEWLDVLMSTVGFNPDTYTRRQKLLVISRLSPLVEANLNMTELAPKGTGKTHMLRHTSSYARIISGGTISSPTLFYNLATKTPGILATNDCVVFDEIQNTSFQNPGEMIGKLKDFMESGNFDRGHQKVTSEASVILLGNIPTSNGQPATEDYFSVLPEEMHETAFLDRLHGFIPGWELPRIQDSETHLTRYWGLASDYFGEVLHGLRSLNHQLTFQNKIRLINADIRDEKAVKRLTSAFIKLFYPHGKMTDEELEEIVRLAISYRETICYQLALRDHEYKFKSIGFEFR